MNIERDEKLLHEAFKTIEQLRGRLAQAAKNNTSEDEIVIIGAACQLPGGIDSLDELWTVLKNGECVVDKIPFASRFESTKPDQYAGMIADPFGFDNAFFGISPLEARHLDPQHRLLLMRTEEALQCANVKAQALRNTNTGVFIGIGNMDYYQRIVLSPDEKIDAYVASGNSPSMAAGRISHHYSFKGPSVSFDTACSSSLFGIHQACKSIQQKEANYAIVGAVNLILTPLLHDNFTQAGMLAKDGRCKVFAADADGYVRSEGCVVLILTTRTRAENNGHPILAVIKGSAVNHDGHTNGLTVPNGPSQAEVIKRALAVAGLSEQDIDYLETHGTGTALGDPIEVGALNKVFAERKNKLSIGAVKANVGHLEIAAGMVSILKAICLLHYRQIPPQIYCDKLNSHIEWENSSVQIDTQLSPWPHAEKNTFIGLSGFGFSGTNAHIILMQGPQSLMQLPRPQITFNLSHFEVPYHARREVSIQTAPDILIEDWQLLAKHPTFPSDQIFQKIIEQDKLIPEKYGEKYCNYMELMAKLEQKCIEALQILPSLKLTSRYIKMQAHLQGVLANQQLDKDKLHTWDYLQKNYSAYPQEIEFIKTCLEALEKVLTGNLEPAHLLFAGAESSLALKYYSSQSTEYFNHQIAQAVAVYCKSRSENADELRILEVGAGSGATTQHLLPVLKNTRIKYYFTDVSSYFLNLARNKFSEYDFIHYDILDITQPLPENLSQFDVIIAANVIHATSDIKKTLMHLKAQLLPQGIFILRECTKPTLTADLTFGLNDGWWLFEQDPHRSDYPLVTAQKWTALLKLAGFGQVYTCAALMGSYEHVLIAMPAAINHSIVLVTNSTQKNNDIDEVIKWNKDHDWDKWCKAQKNTLASTQPNELIFYYDATVLTDDDLSATWQQFFLTPIYCIQAIKKHQLTSRYRISFVCVKQEDANKNVLARSMTGCLSGLARVIALEYPHLYRGNMTVSPGDPPSLNRFLELMIRYPREHELFYNDQILYARRLKKHTCLVTRSLRIDPNGSYLITGASGGLGLATARWLANHGVKHLVLLARTIEVTAIHQLVSELALDNIKCVLSATDLADEQKLQTLFSRFGTDLPFLKGIFHSAGVGGDCYIEDIREDSLPGMVNSKITGTFNLHRLGNTQPLDYFVVYSSVIATWGAKARAHYAAVNAFATELAHARWQANLPALVIDWGPWNNTGMIDEASLGKASAVGLQAVNPQDYYHALERVFMDNLPHAIIASVDWKRFAHCYGAGESFSLVDNLINQTIPEKIPEQPEKILPLQKSTVSLTERITEIFSQVLGYSNTTQISTSRGLYDQGLDSLLALTFVDKLNAEFSQKLTLSDLFSYPNIESLSKQLGLQIDVNLPASTREKAEKNPENTSIAVIGMSCHFPGAETLQDFWKNLCQEKTAFSSVPADRYFSEPFKNSEFKAGFIEHVFEFDAEFFQTTDSEALYLDPQQRLILQTMQRALIDAGFQIGQSLPKKTAVIIGASGSEHGHLCLSKSVTPNPYSIIGNSLNAIAGRVAYFLGTEGPAFAVDSACSSSLVAASIAMDLLASKKIDMAIVGGVNLLLSEESTLALQKTTVLSPDFTCLPFAEQANGMVRGEGCGIIILMRKEDAIAQNFSAYANLVASGVNQDGRSVQLTAPNGQAQQKLLADVLQAAGIDSEAVEYIEAHGTATKLGDPIELDAIAAVFGARKNPLYIGSVKGNIGHLESAAGIASLIKASLICHHQQLVPNVTKGVLTKGFDWKKWPIRVSDKIQNLISGKYIGVSGFGFSGTNAHIILSPVANSGLKAKRVSQTLAFKTKYYRYGFDLSAAEHLPAAKSIYYYENDWLPAQDLNLTDQTKKRRHALIVTPDSQLEKCKNFDSIYQTSEQCGFNNVYPILEKLLTENTEIDILFYCMDNWLFACADTFIDIGKKLLGFLQYLTDFPTKSITLITLNISQNDEYFSPLSCLMRTFADENSHITALNITLDAYSSIHKLNLLIGYGLQKGYRNLQYTNGKIYYPQLVQKEFISIEPAVPIKMGVALITGGNGDIGRELVDYLAKQGVKQIALVNRSTLDKHYLQQLLAQYPACTILSLAVDITDKTAFAIAIQQINQQLGAITTVYHLAGVIANGLLASQEMHDFENIIAAKMHGAWNCHELTLEQPIEGFFLFSSACVYLGARGQGAYQFANAYLMQIAKWRRQQNLPALSIAWGAWKNSRAISSDMVQQNLMRIGMQSLSSAQACDRLCRLQNTSQICAGVFDIDWQRFAQVVTQYPADAAYFSALVIHDNVPTPANALTVHDKVLNAINQILTDRSPADIDPHKPLETYGLGSLALIDLTEKLTQIFNAPLPSGFLYSYTTLAAIVDYFEKRQIEAPSSAALESSNSSQDIAIVGMSCRFGGHVKSLKDFWSCMTQGETIISRNNRAGWLARIMEMQENTDIDYISTMGLIEDYQYFDISLFGLSPREAGCMDPQHRLALEEAWHALEDANIHPIAKTAVRGGIFVGAGTPDFAQILSQNQKTNDTFIGTGSAVSILAGRLAYLFNWCGPALVIDTACSSSLVAVHQACEALKAGSCDIALAGGVNLILSPTTSLLLAQSQALSPSGLCRPFSQVANGYVRAEGCAFVVLKPLANALKEGDRIYAVIKGNAINQDGRSQGLTAPNGMAQQSVMQQALDKTQIKAAEINFIEAHGTGTPLGDPIEMESIQAVYGHHHNTHDPLYIGTLKANIGHTECTAGIASLIKSSLMLYHKILPVEIPAVRANQPVNCHFSLKTQSWKPTTSLRYAAVNSFGFSGTNVHIVLSEANASMSAIPLKTATEFKKIAYPVMGYDDIYKKYFDDAIDLPDNHCLYQMFFSTQYPFMLADHILQEQIVVPGAFYLFLTLELLAKRHPKAGFRLDNILFSSALRLKTGDLAKLQWQIQNHNINIYAARSNDEWINRCRFRYSAFTDNELTSISNEFEQWRKIIQDKTAETSSNYYDFLKSQSVYLGNAFQAIKQIWIENEVVICRLDLEDLPRIFTAGGFDSFFQTAGIYLRHYGTQDGGGVRIPVSIDNIIQYQMLSFPCFTVTHANQSNERFDIDVFSAEGDKLLSIAGLYIKQVAPQWASAQLPQFTNSVYGWGWQPISNAKWIKKPESYKLIWQPGKNEIKKMLDELLQVSGPVLFIVDLFNLSNNVMNALDFSHSLYILCSELIRLKNFADFQLQIITGVDVKFILGDVLLGCLQTLSLECPELSWYWHQSDRRLNAKKLGWWQTENSREHIYKHELNNCFARRLQRKFLNDNLKYSIPADECLVIIGGNSAIAQAIIPLLQAQGIHKIIRIQRQSLDDPLVYQADIFSAASLKKLFNKIENKHGKIASVFHLIGSYADAVFTRQTQESFDAALLPKIESATTICKVLEDYRHIHLVLFSSAACIFGGMGQGSYAGANAYLHALAKKRRSQHLPTTVIAWADWQLSSNIKSSSHKVDIGLKPIDADEALNILWHVMAQTETIEPIEAVFNMDWEVLANHSMRRLLSAEFDQFFQSHSSQQKNRVTSNDLKKYTIYERKNFIENQLRKIICRILTITDDVLEASQLLSSYGLESISSLELREAIFTEFKVNISIAQIFDRLTLDVLINLVSDQVNDKSDDITNLAKEFNELEQLLGEVE